MLYISDIENFDASKVFYIDKYIYLRSGNKIQLVLCND